MKIDFKRNLPHMYREDAIYNINFRLANSLPRIIISNYLDQKNQLLIDNRKLESRNLYYEMIDPYLDHPKEGPLWLMDPIVMDIVKSSLHYFEKKYYSIICFCIMGNHVHLIINTLGYPSKPLGDLLGSIKKYSARKINIHMGRSGSFWHPESYDHIIRSRNELADTIDYVIKNPVKAGLIENWEKWPGTYIHQRYLSRL